MSVWICPFCKKEYGFFGRLTDTGLCYHLYVSHESELTSVTKLKPTPLSQE